MANTDAGQAAAQAVVAAAPGRTALPVATSPGALAAPAPHPAAGALAAAATGGNAGLQAYNDAQAGLKGDQAASQSNAAALASLLGGPESQGFGAIADRFYNQGQQTLGINKQALANQQAAYGASNSAYDARIKAALPLIQANTAEILAGYEAKARSKAAAKFPTADVLGATNLAMDQATAAAPAAQQAAKVASDATDNQLATSKSNVQPIIDKVNSNGKRIDQVKSILAHPGRAQATELPKYEAELAHLQAQNARMMAAINKQNPIEQGKIDALRGVSTSKQTLADSMAHPDPVAIGRNIALNQFGRGVNETYGNVNPSTFNAQTNASIAAQNQALGAQAVGIANKINQAPVAVANVLQRPDVQTWISHAQMGSTTKKWADVQKQLSVDFLQKGDPLGYAVVQEAIRYFPYKKK